MHEVYIAAYERVGNRWQVHLEPAVVKPDKAPRPEGHGWMGCGNAFAAYPALIDRLRPILASVLPDVAPTAVAIGALALPLLVAGLGVSAANAAPIYAASCCADDG